MGAEAILSDVECPFNSLAYVAGLRHVGRPYAHPSGHFAILRRDIPGTGLQDGISPWPYLWISGPDQIRALQEDFADLVTLTILCQPGYIPIRPACDAILLKHHFIYDPRLPPPPLSPRARARVEACARHAAFEVVTDRADRLAICDLYDALKVRRGLGGMFDMGASHFQAIAGLKECRFFRVRSGEAIGAMACGVVFGGMLQILHTVPTGEGLRWNASYLMMHGLQDFARAHGLQLLIGGMPAGGRPGLNVFKSRWVNRSEPVYMIRIVNDPKTYARLRGDVPGDDAYFPAYRRPE